MTWRISRNGQPKTKSTSIPRRVKRYFVTGKRLQHELSEETATLKQLLCFDATNIGKLSHHKLLGLIFDKDLSFEAHRCRRISLKAREIIRIWTKCK